MSDKRLLILKPFSDFKGLPRSPIFLPTYKTGICFFQDYRPGLGWMSIRVFKGVPKCVSQDLVENDTETLLQQLS